MSKIGGFLCFVGGFGLGFLTAGYLLNKKYAALTEEEIASVKEVYAREAKDKVAEIENKKAEEHEQAVLRYHGSEEKVNYRDLAKDATKKTTAAPKVITPEDFGEQEGYDTIEFTYYADGTLTDDRNVPIDDPEKVVGDALDHFGEIEEDSVYVRNDFLKADFQILLDERTYSQVVTEKAIID